MRGEGARAIIPDMTGDPHRAECPAPGHGPPIRASRLPHAMAAMYALAIAYASLQPFGEWMAPLPGTPFWAFTPWSMRATRFDIVANVLAYLPLGFFVALLPPRATPALRAAIAALAGAALSAAMETLQWFLPARSASVTDLVANAAGALAGGLAGAFYAQSRLRGAMRHVRGRAVLPGTTGDVGLALLAVWLVAQTNPAIAPFALTFDPAPIPLSDPDAAAVDMAAVLIEAAESAFQLVGVGLFAALLARDRRYAGGAVLLAVGAALLIKGIAAFLLLKPAVFESWLSYGVLLGIAAGALLLLPGDPAAATRAGHDLRDRPAVVAACAPVRPRRAAGRGTAHAVQLALRASAELQWPDTQHPRRVATRRSALAVRAGRAAGLGPRRRGRARRAGRTRSAIIRPPPRRVVMSYYQRHVFFCCNQREAPEKCCNEFGATELSAYAKARVKALGQAGEGKVRVNKAGCLDRCEEGPVIVVYPEAVWYTYVDRADIDEIIDRHVLRGEIVERLRI